MERWLERVGESWDIGSTLGLGLGSTLTLTQTLSFLNNSTRIIVIERESMGLSHLRKTGPSPNYSFKQRSRD